jgi:putative redox protein
VSKPPTVVDLVWQGDLKFAVVSDRAQMTLDSAGVAGMSPVQALGAALAGCMTTDVAFILRRGHHPMRALRAHLRGERARHDPHRLVRVTLHITVEGNVPGDVVAHAIELSRDKYCSVWHSMRQDIDFQVTFDLLP